MRKLLMTTAALAVVLCFVNDVHAFDFKYKCIISAFGGVGVPVGDFADDDSTNGSAGGAGTGFDVGAAVEYGATDEFLVGVRFAYNRFGVKDDAFADLFNDDTVDVNWSVIEILGAHVKYMMLPGSRTRPFVRGGAFLASPELTVDGSGSNLFELSLGLDAAVGVTHMLSSRVGVSLEARYAHLFLNHEPWATVDEVRRFAPSSVTGPTGVRDPGGNLTWLAVNAVVSYGL